jgi:hypothetical protein
LDLEKQDAIERDNNKQIDQLAQKEKAVITATIVEPKVKFSLLLMFLFIKPFCI